jgi:phage-related minor tail protein
MAKNIKGITIELDGNTRPLQKALADVDKKTRDLTSELRQVDKALKFNPDSVELLAQKQQLLSEAVEATTTRLDRLRAVQDQVEDQFKSGKIGADQWRAYQREVIQTESKLKSLKSQIEKLDDSKAPKNLRDDLNKVEKSADQAEGAISELAGAIGGLAAGEGVMGAIEKALDASSLKTKIDITLEVPESSKKAVRDAIKVVESYGLEAEEALEGVRRQWALNRNASDQTNAAIIKGAAAIARAYADIDFKELIQESHEVGKELKIGQNEALGLINALLRVGFPPEQLDIVSEYGQQLRRAGFEATEIQAIFEAGIETGTWNIDNLLDGLKEGRIRLAEFGKEIPKSLGELLKEAKISEKQMQAWGKAVARGGKDGKKAMTEVAKTLSKVEDATLRNALGVEIFGTMYEDQGDNIIATLINAEKKTISLKKNQDQLNDAVKKMDADPAVKWSKAMSDLKTALQPLLGIIADVVSSMAKWISENPRLAATIAAVGTALGILSGIVLALGPAWAALTATAALFGTTVGGLAVAIGAGVVAVAGITTALMKNREESKKAAEDARRFGEGVSEGTVQAARGYMDLRDQALVNLAKLRTATGEEARKIVNETVQIFGEMGDKVIAALNEDKINVQKSAASLLEQVPGAIEPAIQKITDTALKAIDTQIRKVQEANATIRKGLVEYGGDVKKMPAEFAKAYQQALVDLDQTSQTFVKKVSDLKNYSQKITLEQGKITAEGAAKWAKDINKAYDEAIKSAKNWAKEQRLVWEEQFANNHITKEAYDEMIRIIDEAEKERISIAKNSRKESLQTLFDGMTEEAHIVDLKTGEILEKHKQTNQSILGDHKTQLAKRKLLNKQFLDDVIQDTDRSADNIKKSQEKLIQALGNAGTESIAKLADALKKGGKVARLAAESVAVQTEDGFKVDLGDKGLVSIQTFIDGMKKGQYTARDVSIAHMNQLKNIYGSGQWQEEGIQAVESFAKGLRSKKPEEVAKQMGLDLKSQMEIDLGPYGKVTAESFAKGLSDGTYSFDAVYAYFLERLKEGATFDLSPEGRKSIETLKLGMQSGAIDAADAARLLGLNIESAVNINLKDKGIYSVTTLLSGFQEGKISIEEFVSGMNQLIKEGAKLDLSTEGKDTGNSLASGLSGSKSNIETASKMIQEAVQRRLGSTTDGGGGKKAAQAMQSGLANQFSPISQAARTNKDSVVKILGSATDGGGGKKASGEFAKGIAANQKKAGSDAKNVATAARDNLKVSGAYGIGSNISSGFASGIRSGKSGVISAAIEVASAAISSAKKWLGIKSPSKKGIEMGENVGEGFEIGIRNQIAAVARQAQQMADAAIFDVPSLYTARSQLGSISGSANQPFSVTINNNFDNISIRRDEDLAVLAKLVSQANAREFDRIIRTVAGGGMR